MPLPPATYNVWPSLPKAAPQDLALVVLTEVMLNVEAFTTFIQ
jgi:hypothetical protein